MQLTQEEDIRALYAILGLVGSLLGMALVGETITKEDALKLGDALDLAKERMRTLNGETNAQMV